MIYKIKKKYLVLIFLLLSKVTNSQNDSIIIKYPIGAYKLVSSQKQILSIATDKLDKTNKYNVTIVSSADYIGAKKDNLILSEKRANNIKRFLLNKNDSLFNNFTIINQGEIQSAYIKNKKGEEKNRKSIVFFKPLSNVNFFNKKEYKVGEKIVLKNLIFYIGSVRLYKKSQGTLKDLFNFLKANSDINIEISGHVCCGKKSETKKINTNSKLYKLSVQRAKAIYNYLTYKGIDKNRLTYKGYGFSKPLYFPEKSHEDKKRNKRVEITITDIKQRLE